MFPNLFYRQAIPAKADEVTDESQNATTSEKAKSYVLSFPQSFAVSDEAPAEKVCIQVKYILGCEGVCVQLGGYYPSCDSRSRAKV